MATVIISPNMNLPVPVVGQDPGPEWATNVDACLSGIDAHTHTTGQGVQIPSSGLNINTDLPAGGNNITALKSTRFTVQGSPLSSGSDIGCVYVSGADLYYNDVSGNQVRLTASGSPAGGAGSITGLPSGTASAAYSASTFIFQSATSTPASISGGPLKIARDVASGKGVTISASAGTAADFNWTLPSTNSTVTSLLNITSAGQIGYGANVTAAIFVPVTTTTYISGGTVNITKDTTYAYYFQVGNFVIVQSQVNFTNSAWSGVAAVYSWSQTIPVSTTTLFVAGQYLNAQRSVSPQAAPLSASSNTAVITGINNITYASNATGSIAFSYAYIVN